MDFVIGLLRIVRGFDSVWVIMGRMTKSVHFFLVKMTFSAFQYAQLYIDKIVRLYRVLCQSSQIEGHSLHLTSGELFKKL